jgi:hypothetical protein
MVDLPDNVRSAAVSPNANTRRRVIENADGNCQCAGCGSDTHPGMTAREKAGKTCKSRFSDMVLSPGWTIDPSSETADGTDPREYRVLCPPCTKSWGDLYAVADEHDESM